MPQWKQKKYKTNVEIAERAKTARISLQFMFAGYSTGIGNGMFMLAAIKQASKSIHVIKVINWNETPIKFNPYTRHSRINNWLVHLRTQISTFPHLSAVLSIYERRKKKHGRKQQHLIRFGLDCITWANARKQWPPLIQIIRIEY